ncbi:MAG: AAA family ATPase, partial [Pseudomonadales bacterium]
DLAEQSQRFLNHYLEYCGDYAGLRLLNMYRNYYALVRAKVKLMRRPAEDDLPGDNEDIAAVCRHVMLAEKFTRTKQPLIVLMHGLSGSGKSWLAEQLMTVGDTIRIRSDVERKRLFGEWPEPTGGIIPDMYSKKASDATFERLHELAGLVTSAGFNCIVDATFLSRARRKPFLEWALRKKLQLAIVSCHAPEDVIMERLQMREKEASDPSDANMDIYKLQKVNVEDFLPEERNRLIEVDTTRNDCVERVVARLAL